MPIVALTAAFTKSIHPPESGSAEYWDERTPGLCLRVFASGRASWSFRYRSRNGGGYERVTLGPLADLTLSDARERASKLKVQVHDGGSPQLERRQARVAAADVLTFSNLADRYLDEYAKPNKSSWRQDEIYLKRPKAKWGDRPAQSITRKDAVALLDSIKVEAPVSANRTQSVLSGMFNWAIEGDLLTANPVAGMKKRAKEQSKERTLTDVEIAAMMAALESPQSVSVDVADALRVILLTGQRPGEIAGLVQSELRHIEREREAHVEFPRERMKARRQHVLPLGGRARATILAALERRKVDGDKSSVFASKFSSRNTLARHSLSQGLAREIAKMSGENANTLKADPPTPHDFRRTVATGLAALGVSREDRKAVLAHVEGDVHGVHYDKYERLKEKRAALERWEKHIDALGLKEFAP